MTTLIKNSVKSISVSTSDLGLIEQIATGEAQALEELYHRYSAPLLTYLSHLLYEETVAEELLQEVFIAVWMSAKRFRGKAAVKTWIFQIAHHLGVSWLRKKKLHLNYIQNYEIDPPGSVDDLLHEDWLKKTVLAALGKLSAEHRAVVELVYYHGLSYEETAYVVQCPVGTVKSRVSYAKRYLDQFLTASGVDPFSGDESKE
jgi:RNA polymerase sigma-70 factor (ECF subfamily)